jgi:hypothetical protein
MMFWPSGDCIWMLVCKVSILQVNNSSCEAKIQKISNAPKVRKPSCEHMDGQCLVQPWPFWKCSSVVIFDVIDELVTSCFPCISIFAEIRARSIFRHFGGHFENHSQIGNSGSSVNIHLVGIYFCANFG